MTLLALMINNEANFQRASVNLFATHMRYSFLVKLLSYVLPLSVLPPARGILFLPLIPLLALESSVLMSQKSRLFEPLVTSVVSKSNGFVNDGTRDARGQFNINILARVLA